ncbi:hypothetical protein BU075_12925 [Mammaliicoccus vitulinus]|uniref:hypothetical protein n=1 Tax=Mammaliicoccus vitulinus TaxID=71237 RepID=UPI0002FCFF74|nr:hypothetical protein [Mammaliicoccus vitulinus]QJF24218.1 hypothetical protein HF021_01450 [Mammaliicoccus vitulinus]RIN13397.1 hypothetical protein BU075_12925 [Mammaliicoccus vitulinus]
MKENTLKPMHVFLCSLLLLSSLVIFTPPNEANAMSVEDCTAMKTGSEYGQTFKNAAIIGAINNPSWSNFKKAASNLIKAGVKGNIIAVSYSLYNNYNECVKIYGGNSV